MRPFSKSSFAEIKIKRTPKGEVRDFSRYYIVLLLVSLFIAFITLYKKPFSPGMESENLAVSPNVNQATSNSLASTFPKSVPLAGKLNILQSYDASYPDNPVKQSNVVFRSSKSVNSLIDFYSKWAATNDWEIVNPSENRDPYFLYLQKEKESMNITIKDSEVSINYLQRP